MRGQVKRLELSGVGELTGDAANAAIDVLLDHAVLKSADATARRQTLTVTLDSGLRLQLGVSGDTLCGCGGWSCPEFFEAFEAALCRRKTAYSGAKRRRESEGLRPSGGVWGLRPQRPL